MSYKEDHARAAELAARALEKMSALQIAPHPDNFEVWYAYHAELDAELSRKISTMLEELDDYDPSAYLDIKQSFFGEDASQLLKTASDNVESTIASALTSIDAASSNARDYGDKLADFSGDIDMADDGQLHSKVAKLAADTREVMQRNAELENELKSASERIESLRGSLEDARRASETDGLTGLPNRRAFDLGLEAEIERARMDDAPLSLIVTDVDHFKKFNDQHGHRVGDEVLKLVSRVMRSMLKGGDKPARYGGEEFCIILPATDSQGAFAVAEQVRKAIAAKALKSARTGESYGQVTLSFGCAQVMPGDTPEGLFERADDALLMAKRTGRNRTCTEEDLGAAREAG